MTYNQIVTWTAFAILAMFNDEPPSSYGNLLFTGNSKIGPQSDRGEEGARGVMPKKTGHFL